MINMNVLLFDSKKANVGVIRNISNGDPCHQPAKKSEGR